jgi:hypothetical protein
VAVGKDALGANTTGTKNTAIGYDALSSNLTGELNTAIGYNCGTSVTGGVNTLIGGNVGYNITSGSGNVVIGRESGCQLGAGGSNTAIGNMAMEAGSGGGWNTCIGNHAGRLGGGNGAYSASVGAMSLYSVSTGASGNVAMGYASGYYISSGDQNVCIGAGAGNGGGVNSHTALTTGSQNILLGPETDTSAADSTNQIVMGDEVAGNANDSLCFGHSTTDSAIAFGATSITAPSDIRLKEDIEDEVVGLDFINELRPVTFRWKKAKDVPEELKAHSTSEKRVMNGKYNHGFISQEVKEVIDNNPDIKEGFDMWTEDEADGRQRIGESALIPMLVKSIQELTARIEELEGE